MVKKVKKPIIKPFENKETVNLKCNSYLRFDYFSTSCQTFIVRTNAPIFPASNGEHSIAVSRKNIELLIKALQRAEKTFQKR